MLKLKSINTEYYNCQITMLTGGAKMVMHKGELCLELPDIPKTMYDNRFGISDKRGGFLNFPDDYDEDRLIDDEDIDENYYRQYDRGGVIKVELMHKHLREVLDKRNGQPIYILVDGQYQERRVSKEEYDLFHYRNTKNYNMTKLLDQREKMIQRLRSETKNCHVKEVSNENNNYTT